MDNLAGKPQIHDQPDDAVVSDAAPASEIVAASESDGRAAQRFTLLIRAAKLVSHHGEFVCVLRDLSETGICVRLFHKVPHGDPIELHMPGGGVYELRLRWERDREAGFEFTHAVDVARLVNEAGQYPKRGLRLGVLFPIKLRTQTEIHEAVVENLSQQGARFETDALFAIDQSLTVDSLEGGVDFSDIRAKVRWRRDSEYGVVFDNTLSLEQFARLAARLQCPKLLD